MFEDIALKATIAIHNKSIVDLQLLVVAKKDLDATKVMKRLRPLAKIVYNEVLPAK